MPWSGNGRACRARSTIDPLQRLAAVAQRLDTRDELSDEAAIVRSVSGQLRDLSVRLHPPVLEDLGLGPALADLGERLEQESGIPIRVTLEDPSPIPSSPRPPGDVELAVYRVAQEALGNAIQHSGAGQIDLQARVRPDQVRLVVQDDGVGIDAVTAREAIPRGHVGLHSMAERSELIGARLRIEPARPGTRVMLTWPA